MKPRDWGKLIVADLICVAAAAGLAITAKTVGIIAAVVIAAGAVAGTAHTLKKAHNPAPIETAPAAPHITSAHTTVSPPAGVNLDETDARGLSQFLDAYRNEPHVGPAATRLKKQIDDAKRRETDYTTAVTTQFGNGAAALRFLNPVTTAVETITGNARAAAKLLKATDMGALADALGPVYGSRYSNYRTGGTTSAHSNYIATGPTRWADSMPASAASASAPPQSAAQSASAVSATSASAKSAPASKRTSARDAAATPEQQRAALYQGVIDRLNQLSDANDKLLVAVETAQVNLSSLSESDADISTTSALSELDRLSHDLDYYR